MCLCGVPESWQRPPVAEPTVAAPSVWQTHVERTAQPPATPASRQEAEAVSAR